jgi:NAD(P)-dependent dehydrogenase (short-subunit alcohol dehydrogenase family)
MRALRGKVAVVTGAASGIGRGLAARFAAEGMDLVLADIDAAALDAVTFELAFDHPVELLTVPTDVSDADAVEALAERALARFGTVHVICNNAGVLGRFATAWELPIDEWRWQFDANLWGVVHGIRSFVPVLVEQDEGHVVNTASAAAWVTAPGLAPYAATKHAVLAVSEALRLELRASKSRVGVSVLCPHFVKTSILSSGRHPRGDGDVGATADSTVRVRNALTKGIERGVPPSVIAAEVVAGIKENRFVISDDVDTITAHARRRISIAGGAPPDFVR